jgi:hypothetical protein
MIIPSTIQLSGDLRIEEVESGMFSVPNAYEGDYQEFFEGRLTPIHFPDPINQMALGRLERIREVADSLGLTTNDYWAL